jgi:hypothetical protein
MDGWMLSVKKDTWTAQSLCGTAWFGPQMAQARLLCPIDEKKGGGGGVEGWKFRMGIE